MSLDVGLLGCLTKKEKENYYALHYRCYFDYIVAPGVNHFQHHGRFHSRASGNRHRGCIG
jgi:hypothetical protein